MKWIYERAVQRAGEFHIEGVTLQLTTGVVKRIIPAIASTNAIIAAACANEVVKYVTGCAPNVQNWMFYNGQTAINTNTMDYKRSRVPHLQGVPRVEVGACAAHGAGLVPGAHACTAQCASSASAPTATTCTPPARRHWRRRRDPISVRLRACVLCVYACLTLCLCVCSQESERAAARRHCCGGGGQQEGQRHPAHLLHRLRDTRACCVV